MRACIRYFRRHHVGFLALFIALSGTAYAASLPRDSVGTKQLKRNAVTSAKVKNSTLRARDFADGVLRKGDSGPPGPQGPKGDPGPPGVTGIVVRQNDRVPEPDSGAAFCKEGEVATGGGGQVFSTEGAPAMVESRPFPEGNGQTPSGWRVAGVNPEGTPYVAVWVVCARLP